MAEMVKLFVNGQEVEVEAGKNLIDAIGAVGIEIPHLCYHPALGADGNCRMCLVGIEDGRPPLVPACKTPAAEGMKVQLDTDKIKKIQRDIMELELVNHPIDCPICDQAGECSLQDYYMTYDGRPSRVTTPKVAKEKKLEFGCGVVHDQERCILCARCVRFTRLITKTGELGIVNRTDQARVRIFPGRPLDNRYALNVVDLCPVGAMTSKDFRFQQRVWFLKNGKGVCHGCSKGCSIYVDHNREKYKDDVIYRYRPRLNEQVNGYFICDEGRMTYKLENENRLTTAKVAGSAVPFAEGLQAAKALIDKAEKAVILLSPNCSLEQMMAAKQFAALKNATLSGYSESYIKAGDGDDYLIQDDKSANRAGLELLEISTDKESFDAAMQEADLLITLQSNAWVQNGANPFSIPVLAVQSRDDEAAALAKVALPAASYTEYAGSVINVDGILQSFDAVVVKNEPLPDLLDILCQMGGTVADNDHAWKELKKSVAALSDLEPAQIPEQGVALNDSEATDDAA